MKKLTTILLLIFFSSTIFSQEKKFQTHTKFVAKKSTEGKAFEVSKKSIATTQYKYDWIDNPEYLIRIHKIDSIQKQINNLKNKKNNFLESAKEEFGILSSKKKKKESKIKELETQISLLKKDIPPINGMSIGYTYKIPKKIKAYIQTGNMQREILVIDPAKNVSPQLEGDVFAEEIKSSIGITYILVNQDTLHFKKNELIAEDSIRKYFRNDYKKLSTEIGFIIKRESDNSIFCVDNDFVKNLIEQKEYEFTKILDNLGITVESSPNHSSPVLVNNNKKCTLTEEIRNYLESKKNADVIDKVNNSVAEYRNLLKQQENISLKLVKHAQAYKSGLITSSRRIEWEKDTKSAVVIGDKMKKLPYYDSIAFQLNQEENRLHSAILDIIYASKITLGI